MTTMYVAVAQTLHGIAILAPIGVDLKSVVNVLSCVPDRSCLGSSYYTWMVTQVTLPCGSPPLASPARSTRGTPSPGRPAKRRPRLFGAVRSTIHGCLTVEEL